MNVFMITDEPFSQNTEVLYVVWTTLAFGDSLVGVNRDIKIMMV